MAYTPYDWQHTLSQKVDYVEDRLKRGSPVIALSCKEGILILTTRRSQGKIFEVYDRLAFAGLGNPSDLEAVRHAVVDFCHAEGFQRSPEDVTIQRVVGFGISPAIKRNYADPFQSPIILRGLFAQVGRNPEDDLYFSLNFDGEFTQSAQGAAIAGTVPAIHWMERVLADGKKPKRAKTKSSLSLNAALEKAFKAWTVGSWAVRSASGEPPGSGESPSEKELQSSLKEALEDAEMEAALLDRAPHRDRRLRFLAEEDLQRHLP
ncbi:hypothetical protein HY229_06935 [Candidatus Acetothermia bacterium]|nr:hypothetical protein [Candidatus Acetothermia bacterium]MBI3643819.1 hypothetical protein [Candidatus Acetothermia bacterium]